MIDRQFIEETIKSADYLLRNIALTNSLGNHNRSKQKKLDEILGFSEHLFKVINNLINKNDKEIVFLECSCGKSYLSFVINYIFAKSNKDLSCYFYGIDKNNIIIDMCNQIKGSLGYNNMEFIDSKIIDYVPEKKVDIVIALHACDTATDEAIAKGINVGAKFIVVVPCCQNQIRSQLKKNHSLTALTEFGLLRYRFANNLTDALRSQFLKGHGYSVELKEITSTRTTPKNLIIIARKQKKKKEISLSSYNELCSMFKIDFKLQELLEGCVAPL